MKSHAFSQAETMLVFNLLKSYSIFIYIYMRIHCVLLNPKKGVLLAEYCLPYYLTHNYHVWQKSNVGSKITNRWLGDGRKYIRQKHIVIPSLLHFLRSRLQVSAIPWITVCCSTCDPWFFCGITSTSAAQGSQGSQGSPRVSALLSGNVPLICGRWSSNWGRTGQNCGWPIISRFCLRKHQGKIGSWGNEHFCPSNPQGSGFNFP